MNRVLRNLSMAAVTLILTSALVWAQATAELNGRVTDESGAVLPGVTVTATQTDTGFTRVDDIVLQASTISIVAEVTNQTVTQRGILINTSTAVAARNLREQ